MVATTAKSQRSGGGHYRTLGPIYEWKSFNKDSISQSDLLRPALTKHCTPGSATWVPWIARIIYNERGLESLYDKTLVSRVNIALAEGAATDPDSRISIVIGPGAFESAN